MNNFHKFFYISINALFSILEFKQRREKFMKNQKIMNKINFNESWLKIPSIGENGKS